MIEFQRLILIAALLLAAATSVRGIPVPPNHEIYPFLNRMNVKYSLNLYTGSKPMHKHEIIVALRQLEKHSTDLTQWERKQFHYFRTRFFTGLVKKHSVLVYQNDARELTGSVSHSTNIIYLDSVPDPELIAFGTIDIGVEGQLDSSISFSSRVTFAQERSLENQYSEHYNASFGLPYNTPEKAFGENEYFKVSTFDGYRAIVSWKKKNLVFDFGNDWNQWGPGSWQHPTFAQDSWFWTSDSSEIRRAWEHSQNIESQALTPLMRDSLSELFPWRASRKGYSRLGENAPITLIRSTVKWDILKYTKFFGQRTGIHFDSASYLVGHRLETHRGNFTLGIHEMLTYSRDEIEFGYMIPFISLFMAEHFTGDRDNIAMGIDVQYIFLHKYRFYLELFLDDLVGPGQFFDDYWGNKTAPLLGVEFFDVTIPNTNLKIEYARVDPWVYTHVSGTNQFQNLGSLTGSSLPPNSHAFRFQFTKYFLSGFNLQLDYRFFQHQHLAEGSSLFDTQPLGTSTRKNFLGENPETTHDLSSKIHYRWNRTVNLSALAGYQFISDYRSNPGQDENRLRWEIMWQLVY